jgi:hypothetical protein
MRLEKWYVDVAHNGCLSVHYRASLSLGRLGIAYRGELGDAMPRRGTFSVGPCHSLPRIEISPGGDRLQAATDGGILSWQNARSRPRCLWTDGRRHVTWDPIVLNGTVEGGTGGRGYAEKLVMTVAPWRLGINRLWWGRFCGENRSLVWIVWEGRHPLRLALLDGTDVRLDAVTADAICTQSVSLRLGRRRQLVDQVLGAGALADMPWPKRLAPISFLSGRERKWLAHGELKTDGNQIDRGEVVWETVDWP